MDLVQFLKTVIGSIVVLFALLCISPGELLGGSMLLLNVLIIDRLAFLVSPCFDDNLFLISIVAANFIANLRSAGIAPPHASAYLPALTLQLVWAVLALFITFHSRFPVDPTTPPWVPTFMSLGCGLLALCTYSGLEPFPYLVSRTFIYFFLTFIFYMDLVEFGPGCIIGNRGYLLCFYPVMFVAWPLACFFALASLCLLVYMEQEATAAASYAALERESYTLVQVAPSDII